MRKKTTTDATPMPTWSASWARRSGRNRPHRRRSWRWAVERGLSRARCVFRENTPRMQEPVSLEDDQTARVLAGGQRPERLVRLVHTVAPGDQLVDLELPRHVKVDHPREVVEDRGRAVGRADQAPLGADQRARVDLDGGAVLGEADDDAGGAAGDRVPGLLDGADVADRDDRVVGAAARELLDARRGVLARGVDRVRGAHRPGELELVVGDVHRDQRLGAREPAALDGVEADASAAA